MQGQGPVRWSRDPDNYLPNGVTQQNNNLVFNNVRPDHAGNYVATVYSPQGEVRKILVITVPMVQRIPPSIYSPNQRVTSVLAGDSFTLECVGVGSPVPSIRIETPSRSRFAELNVQPNLQPNRQAKIEISYFTEENAGEYVCIAENQFGEYAAERFRVDLTQSGEPPFILIEPKTIEAYEGSSLSINYTYSVK